jgi:hypothetical protein
MNITPDVIKIVQTSLNRHYKHNLKVDGIAGKNTIAALLQVSAIPTHWSDERKIIGYVQHICSVESINAGPVDGYWGPQTQYGYEQLEHLFLYGSVPSPWRDDEGIGAVATPTDWPVQTQTELEKYYGKVGTNQTLVDVPYQLKIAWEPTKTITKFSCHEKVADSIVRVLDRVADHYQDRISVLGLDLFGGCLNVRPMRGGTKWSTHAWGVAIDWDPARNQLRWNCPRANFCKSEYDVWWKLWEEEGWVSLGRARDYDHMHVQAAKVR